MTLVTQHQVLSVARHAANFAGRDDHLVLSILTRALICCAKTCGISQNVVVRELAAAWDETEPAVTIIGPARPQ